MEKNQGCNIVRAIVGETALAMPASPVKPIPQDAMERGEDEAARIPPLWDGCIQKHHAAKATRNRDSLRDVRRFVAWRHAPRWRVCRGSRTSKRREQPEPGRMADGLKVEDDLLESPTSQRRRTAMRPGRRGRLRHMERIRMAVRWRRGDQYASQPDAAKDHSDGIFKAAQSEEPQISGVRARRDYGARR